MSNLFPAVVLLGCVALSGCALTTDRIEIAYPAPVGVGKVAGAESHPVSVHVTDARLDKVRVGSKKNAFGMEMAPILVTEDVAVTLRRAVEDGLRGRGFRIEPGDASLQVVGELTRFYNDHKPGFFAGDAVAELMMNVVVKGKAGDLLYSRQIAVQGVEPNTQLMTGNNARLALNRALANGMGQLFEDQAFLGALLSGKPASRASGNPM